MVFFTTKLILWDVAAGSLLVEEAGGIVNNIHGYNYNNIDIRAASSVVYDEMLENLVHFNWNFIYSKFKFIWYLLK